MNAFNKELLASHIRTCVAQDIRDGKDESDRRAGRNAAEADEIGPMGETCTGLGFIGGQANEEA